MPDDPDAVTRSIHIDAPPARVWQLVTDPEHLRVWYAFDGASVDLRVGGRIVHHWGEHGSYHGIIDELRAPELLSYRYAQDPGVDPVPGRETRVTFRLEPAAGGTLVTVHESGIAALELTPEERAEYRAATTEGWDGGLPTLAEHAARVAM